MKTALYLVCLISATAIVLMLLPFAACSPTQTSERGGQQGFPVDPQTASEPTEGPPVGISVTLTVYSGLANPTWVVEPGPELERLQALIRGLKTSDERLFNYDEWNRLGYATFWIVTRGLPGLPGQLHVWRHMAYVPAKGAQGALGTLRSAGVSGRGEGFWRVLRQLSEGAPGGALNRVMDEGAAFRFESCGLAGCDQT